MRIDRLELRNFKKFEKQTFEFPRSFESDENGSFHVLVGENGAGKTSILDSLAIALGVWLEEVPDSILANSHRRLKAYQKRLIQVQGRGSSSAPTGRRRHVGVGKRHDLGSIQSELESKGA